MARFDLISRFYDWLPIPTHPSELRDHLASAKGPVVDLGGGTGRFTERIFTPDQQPMVLDPSQGMLARNRRAGRSVSPVLGLGQAMPFPDESIGAIVVTEAFHHFAPHQQAVVEEAARVLRPDGRLVIEEIDPTRALGRLVDWGERLLAFGSNFLEPDELVELLETRFDQVAWERTGSFTYLCAAER